MAPCAKKKTFKIIRKNEVICGKVFTTKTYIPLESKVKRFIKKLNKKERPQSFAIGK